MLLNHTKLRVLMTILGLFMVAGAFANHAIAAVFPHYVYTNDNLIQPSYPTFTNLNSVTGFSADATGKLTKIGQWNTDGYGGCDGYFAAKRNAKIVLHGADYLLAIDNCSGDISIFSGALTGNLTLLGALTFAPTAGGPSSVATNNTCVIVGLYSGEIDSYLGKNFTKVNSVTPSTFVDSLKIVKVSATGQSYVVMTDGLGKISIIPLSKTCGLGTPNTFSGQAVGLSPAGEPADIDVLSNGSIMYVADSNTSETIVEAYAFPAGTPEPGSPYIYTKAGINSNDIILMGNCLFVSNQYNDYSVTPPIIGTGVTAIPLVSVTHLPGTTATLYSAGQDSNGSPSGMAKDANGKSFYVAIDYDNSVSSELIGSKCKLTLGPSSPVATGISGSVSILTAIAAVP